MIDRAPVPTANEIASDYLKLHNGDVAAALADLRTVAASVGPYTKILGAIAILTAKDNGYIAFYRGKQIEVRASTLLDARDKAAKIFKAKPWEVTAVLAEANGVPVVHTPSF